MSDDGWKEVSKRKTPDKRSSPSPNKQTGQNSMMPPTTNVVKKAVGKQSGSSGSSDGQQQGGDPRYFNINYRGAIDKRHPAYPGRGSWTIKNAVQMDELRYQTSQAQIDADPGNSGDPRFKSLFRTYLLYSERDKSSQEEQSQIRSLPEGHLFSEARANPSHYMIRRINVSADATPNRVKDLHERHLRAHLFNTKTFPAHMSMTADQKIAEWLRGLGVTTAELQNPATFHQALSMLSLNKREFTTVVYSTESEYLDSIKTGIRDKASTGEVGVCTTKSFKVFHVDIKANVPAHLTDVRDKQRIHVMTIPTVTGDRITHFMGEHRNDTGKLRDPNHRLNILAKGVQNLNVTAQSGPSTSPPPQQAGPSGCPALGSSPPVSTAVTTSPWNNFGKGNLSTLPAQQVSPPVTQQIAPPASPWKDKLTGTSPLTWAPKKAAPTSLLNRNRVFQGNLKSEERPAVPISSPIKGSNPPSKDVAQVKKSPEKEYWDTPKNATPLSTGLTGSNPNTLGSPPVEATAQVTAGMQQAPGRPTYATMATTSQKPPTHTTGVTHFPALVSDVATNKPNPGNQPHQNQATNAATTDASGRKRTRSQRLSGTPSPQNNPKKGYQGPPKK